jgi:hypothetical protein
MKRTVLLCAILPAVAALAAAPELSQVRAVYLFPMGNGFDQYLANRITASGLFQVVADPKKADAVFTDRLGAALEARLAELYPETPPKPVEQVKKTDKDKPEEAAPPAEVTRSSSFARGKGTIFLVGVKARAVLWSVYEQPKNTLPAELDRTARRIVDGLQRDLKGK